MNILALLCRVFPAPKQIEDDDPPPMPEGFVEQPNDPGIGDVAPMPYPCVLDDGEDLNVCVLPEWLRAAERQHTFCKGDCQIVNQMFNSYCTTCGWDDMPMGGGFEYPF